MSSNPYDRAAVLGKFCFLDVKQKASTQNLLREYGFRAAIRIVARTVRELYRILEIQRDRRTSGCWYYDQNYHLNLAHALECERTFGRNLVRLVIAERAREAAEASQHVQKAA